MNVLYLTTAVLALNLATSPGPAQAARLGTILIPSLVAIAGFNHPNYSIITELESYSSLDESMLRAR